MVDIVINDIRPRIQYVGDGVQKQFVYPFPIFEIMDLEVYLDSTKQETGFTVNGAGLSEGGVVVFDMAPANNVIVTLRRILVIERTSDFQEGGAFRAIVVNKEFDRLIAIQQQVSDEQIRAVALAPEDADASLILPLKADRAGRVMAFDENGIIIASVTVSEIETFENSIASAHQAATSAVSAKEAAETAAANAQTWDPEDYRKKTVLIQAEDMDPSVSLGGSTLGPAYDNADRIDENLTIPAGRNAFMAGPITIADGVTVTVNGNFTVV